MVNVLVVRNRIKQFLSERGLSVYRFVREANISPTTGYSLARNPKQIPDSKTINAICNKYGCKIQDLIEHVPDEHS